MFVKSKINLIPPDRIEELKKMLDEGTLSLRQAETWIYKEFKLTIGYKTIERWKNGKINYKYGYYEEPKPIDKVKGTKANRTSKEIIKKALNTSKVTEFNIKRKIAGEEVKKVSKSKSKKVITSDKVNILAPGKTKEEYRENVTFKANEGPQTSFLASPETDVLYGGAAGGGKSMALIVDPLRSASNPKHRALILRRSLKELRQLIDMSRDLYPKAYPGVRFKETEKMWVFPSGSRIEFGYLEKDADVYQYQGQDFSYIAFDEISQLPTEFPWHYLASRLRTSDPNLKVYLRCTTNPGGPGHHWVKKRYVEPNEPGVPFMGPDGISRRFIPARLRDNPYLFVDGRYQKMLESLPEVQRRQLLDGDWDVAEGMAFPEFQKPVHVVQPFDIPRGWARFKSCDYGFSAPSCVLWAAADPTDGTIIVYKELYQKNLTGKELGDKIIELEMEEFRDIPGVIDHSVFNRTGYAGPTIGETLNRPPYNLKFRPADKNRKAGKVQVHEYLRLNKDTDRPRLQIFSTCTNLIRELSALTLAKNDPEDVDTDHDDHAYDAVRYLLMSRPKALTMQDKFLQMKKEVYVMRDPVYGY